MKRLYIAIIAAVLLAASLAGLGSKSSKSRPDGVAEDRWVKISDSAGLVVTDKDAKTTTGFLFVKRGERWVAVEIEAFPRSMMVPATR